MVSVKLWTFVYIIRKCGIWLEIVVPPGSYGSEVAPLPLLSEPLTAIRAIGLLFSLRARDAARSFVPDPQPIEAESDEEGGD